MSFRAALDKVREVYLRSRNNSHSCKRAATLSLLAVIVNLTGRMHKAFQVN